MKYLVIGGIGEEVNLTVMKQNIFGNRGRYHFWIMGRINRNNPQRISQK